MLTRIMTVLIPVAIFAFVACEPHPMEPPHYYFDQKEGTVHLEGDSVTFNTYYGTGIDQSWFTSASFFPGSDIVGSFDPEGPAMTRIPKLLDEGKVDSLIWALGLNELYHEGWSERYQLLWTDLLQNKVPDNSCIVMVKPWVLPQGQDVRPLTELVALRAWMDYFAQENPNVVLVDWKPILEMYPEYSPIDGVHIDANTEGPASRDYLYRNGLTMCDDLDLPEGAQ